MIFPFEDVSGIFLEEECFWLKMLCISPPIPMSSKVLKFMHLIHPTLPIPEHPWCFILFFSLESPWQYHLYSGFSPRIFSFLVSTLHLNSRMPLVRIPKYLSMYSLPKEKQCNDHRSRSLILKPAGKRGYRKRNKKAGQRRRCGGVLALYAEELKFNIWHLQLRDLWQQLLGKTFLFLGTLDNHCYSG